MSLPRLATLIRAGIPEPVHGQMLTPATYAAYTLHTLADLIDMTGTEMTDAHTIALQLAIDSLSSTPEPATDVIVARATAFAEFLNA